jgi:deoxyribonuclease V
MMAALDVDYEEDVAYAAAVVFRDWADSDVLEEKVVAVAGVDPYQPGQFFRRELPCLLAVLRQLRPRDVLLIDGYVWLDSLGAPGLGASLFQALEANVAVVGVAKTKFRGAEQALQIKRGRSSRPLFVTSAGMEKEGRSGVCVGHARSVSNSEHAPARPPVVGECKGTAVEIQTLTTSQ